MKRENVFRALALTTTGFGDEDVSLHFKKVVIRGETFDLDNKDDKEVLTLLMSHYDLVYAITAINNVARWLTNCRTSWEDKAVELGMREDTPMTCDLALHECEEAQGVLNEYVIDGFLDICKEHNGCIGFSYDPKRYPSMDEVADAA